MDSQISIHLEHINKGEEYFSDLQIEMLQQQLDFSFPDDYIEILKHYNGGEGDVGTEGYLVLFEAEMLYDLNNIWYKTFMADIPEYFLFGKDCADTGYAFHKQDHTYHAFGLMSNFKTDSITFCGNNFFEFIVALGEGKCY